MKPLFDKSFELAEAVMLNKRYWLNTNNEHLVSLQAEELLVTSGFTIINSMDHSFLPQGYTKLWLLAESHFALHSFPEFSQVYLELSSCSESKFILFCRRFEETFYKIIIPTM